MTLSDCTAALAHDALITGWPRLREWLAEDRCGARLHRHLTEAAREWAQHGRRSADLRHRHSAP